MADHKIPELGKELLTRIKLVRRDIGNLLFHFTRSPNGGFVTIKDGLGRGLDYQIPASASAILTKILHEGKLQGTSSWTYGENCVCFTEAPIHEFNSIFSLIEIASSKNERPRYEPYGIAVNKKWLFEKGGRPVIYDHPDEFRHFSKYQKYRFVPYDPAGGVDYSWEREWRIKTDYLEIDSKQTLVVVPTSGEAFEFVYEFADLTSNVDVSDGQATVVGASHKPKWLAVSLDLFGFHYRS